MIQRIKRRLKAIIYGKNVHKPISGKTGAFTPFTEQTALAALMAERKSIDLVCAEDAYLWLYRHDNLYKVLTDKNKNLQLSKLKKLPTGLPEGPEHTALRHILSVDQNAAVFDIGCNYGREAVRMMRTIKAASGMSPLHMFDPGVAGKLAQLNLPLNGFDNFKYYNYAVSDVDGHLLVHIVDGQSQDNKIINRGEEATSIPVKSIRLDSFIKSEHLDADACFIKCDTQGAELEVLRGLEGHKLYQNMAAVIEFFPNGLVTRVKPTLFVAKLCEKFHVFDLGAHRKFFHSVTPENTEPLFDRIKKFNPPFTDLLLISKTLPGAEDLMVKLKREHEEMQSAVKRG